LLVPAKEKMDRDRGYIELVIRKIEIEALCPLRHAQLLKQRAETLGTNDSFFCSNDRKPYAQSAKPSRLLKQLLVDAELNELQVNVYMGHSHNAHTAATSYFHLNRKLVGHAIAAESI
jgi:hypothetical protein